MLSMFKFGRHVVRKMPGLAGALVVQISSFWPMRLIGPLHDLADWLYSWQFRLEEEDDFKRQSSV